jgi:hypothetical protein
MAMTLEERLGQIRAAAKVRVPPEAQAVMKRAIEEVRASGILARTPKVGARAPDFALPNQVGQLVALQDRLARGPVVLSFFRGRW